LPRITYLRQWRKYRELTQEELAAQAGISQGMVSLLETGKSDYTGELLETIAKTLGCTPADLLTRDPLDMEAPWSIWDSMPPEQRRQAIRILRALAEEKI
jgi:transcriptional regulator with XRE-family HTH domain